MSGSGFGGFVYLCWTYGAGRWHDTPTGWKVKRCRSNDRAHRLERRMHARGLFAHVTNKAGAEGCWHEAAQAAITREKARS